MQPVSDSKRFFAASSSTFMNDDGEKAQLALWRSPVETHHMTDGKAVAQMKEGVIFVNTSRGKTQEEHALFEGLTRGRIRAAGTDVFEEEPVGADNLLLNLPNVVVSSHVAGVTRESVRAMAMQVTAEMMRVLRGEKPHVLGNPDCWPRLGHLR